MPDDYREMLKTADLTDKQRSDFEFLVKGIEDARAHYGLPPEPLTWPSLAEMKAWDAHAVEIVAAKVIEEHGGKKDLDDWGPVWLPTQIHDRELPAFTMLTVMADCWTEDEAKALVFDGWTLTEWPSQIGLRYWRTVFDKVGFVCNDEECEIHPEESVATESLTCYRASFSSDKRGLSWTTDLERAEWFAHRGDMAGKGRVMRIWTCEVPADRQYAHLCNRKESEVVADVRGLKVTEVVR